MCVCVSDSQCLITQEETNLDRLKESLARSSDQTVSMLKVLDKFQERLHKLESTIQPVYMQTRNYQLRQDSKKIIVLRC